MTTKTRIAAVTALMLAPLLAGSVQASRCDNGSFANSGPCAVHVTVSPATATSGAVDRVAYTALAAPGQQVCVDLWNTTSPICASGAVCMEYTYPASIGAVTVQGFVGGQYDYEDYYNFTKSYGATSGTCALQSINVSRARDNNNNDMASGSSFTSNPTFVNAYVIPNAVAGVTCNVSGSAPNGSGGSAPYSGAASGPSYDSVKNGHMFFHTFGNGSSALPAGTYSATFNCSDGANARSQTVTFNISAPLNLAAPAVTLGPTVGAYIDDANYPGQKAVNVTLNTNLNSICRINGATFNSDTLSGQTAHWVTLSNLTPGSNPSFTIACTNANPGGATLTLVPNLQLTVPRNLALAVTVQGPPDMTEYQSGHQFPSGLSGINIIVRPNSGHTLAGCTLAGAGPMFSGSGSAYYRTTTSAASYSGTLSCTDTLGGSAGPVPVSYVIPMLTSITVAPNPAAVQAGLTLQFIAAPKDQFGNPFLTAVSWTASGGGSMNPSGLFTAGASAGGPFTVSASATAFGSSASGTASLTVTAVPLSITAFGAVQTGITPVSSFSYGVTYVNLIAATNKLNNAAGLSCTVTGHGLSNQPMQPSDSANPNYFYFTVGSNLAGAPALTPQSYSYALHCQDATGAGDKTIAFTVNPDLSAPAIGTLLRTPTTDPLPANSPAIQFSFATDKNATCSIGGGNTGLPMTPFGTGLYGQPGNGDGSTAHAVNLTTFNGEDWTYTITCTNSNPGGQSSQPSSVRVRQSVDTAPPAITAGPTVGAYIDDANYPGQKAVNVTLGTNIPSTCSINGAAFNSDINNGQPAPQTDNHWVTLNNLTPGSNPSFTIACTNSNPGGATLTLVPNLQLTVPPNLQISLITLSDAGNNTVTSPLAPGTKAVNVILKTNLSASCSITGQAGTASFINSSPTDLWVTLTGLIDGFSDTYAIHCQQQGNAGNAAAASLPLRIATQPLSITAFGAVQTGVTPASSFNYGVTYVNLIAATNKLNSAPGLSCTVSGHGLTNQPMQASDSSNPNYFYFTVGSNLAGAPALIPQAYSYALHCQDATGAGDKTIAFTVNLELSAPAVTAGPTVGTYIDDTNDPGQKAVKVTLNTNLNSICRINGATFNSDTLSGQTSHWVTLSNLTPGSNPSFTIACTNASLGGASLTLSPNLQLTVPGCSESTSCGDITKFYCDSSNTCEPVPTGVTVTMKSPASSYSVGVGMTGIFAAVAEGPNGSTVPGVGVSIQMDNALVCRSPNSLCYNFSPGMLPGPHTFTSAESGDRTITATAYVTDIGGAQIPVAQSAPVTLSVVPGLAGSPCSSAAPQCAEGNYCAPSGGSAICQVIPKATVTVTSPAPGAVFADPATLTVTAQAVPFVAATPAPSFNVSISVDGNPPVCQGQGASCSASTTLAIGAHTVTAAATVADITGAPIVAGQSATVNVSVNPGANAGYVPGEIIVKYKDTLSQSAATLLAARTPFSTALASRRTNLDMLNRKYRVRGARQVFADAVPGTSGDGQVYVLESPPYMSVDQAVQDFQNDPDIEYAQPNYRSHAVWLPNDHYYNSKNSLGDGHDDLWALRRLQMEPAWDITKGEGVTIAVIDSGVDFCHSDIADNLVAGDDWKFSPCNTTDLVCQRGDTYGHGTADAGIIGAVGNNEIGIIGVAPKAKILSIKISRNGESDSSWEAAGIKHAIARGAKVINVSFAANVSIPSDPTIEKAIRDANAAGVITVLPAGNLNEDVLQNSPTNIGGSGKPIVVAATDYKDSKWANSGHGATVDVAAPGVEIITLMATGANAYSKAVVDPGYMHLSGTSLSAPFVSGVAALLKAAYHDLSPDQVRQIIVQSADQIPEGSQLGSADHVVGRLNAYQALQAAKPSPGPLLIGTPVLKDSAGNILPDPLPYGPLDAFLWVNTGSIVTGCKWSGEGYSTPMMLPDPDSSAEHKALYQRYKNLVYGMPLDAKTYTYSITCTDLWGGQATVSGSFRVSPSPAAPKVMAMDVPAITVGDPKTVVTVSGENFTPTTVISLNGQTAASAFVSPTQMSVTLPPDMLQAPQSLLVTAKDPAATAPPPDDQAPVLQVVPVPQTPQVAGIPEYIPTNGSVQIPDQGYSTTYSWNFIPLDGTTRTTAAAARSSELSMAVGSNASGGYTLSTKNASLSLKQLLLPPGRYQIQLTATNLAGRTSLPATATITLVPTELSDVVVYPNPWRSDQSKVAFITFGGIPLGSTVKIFTVSGHWISTVHEGGTGKAQWDLTNDSGEKVQSGLYLYLVTDPQGGKAHGKFAVIR